MTHIYQRSSKHNDNRYFGVIKAKQENGRTVIYKRILQERCPDCKCRIQWVQGKKYCFMCDKQVSVTIA